MPMHAHGASGASFVGMWALMMVPMMLPVLAPVLVRARRPVMVSLGYYGVWAAVGVAVHVAGRVVGPMVAGAPWVSGVVVLVAGGLQFTAWKARALARCQAAAAGVGALCSAVGAWRHGSRLGVHCVRSCAGPTAVLLALGAMDLRVMIVVAGAITAERLARQSLLAARIGGALAVGAGVVLLSQVS